MTITRIESHDEIHSNPQIAALLSMCIVSPTEGKIRKAAQTTYSKNQGFFYVLEDNSQVIGIIGGTEIDGVKFILKHLAVKEDQRNKGYARNLIEHLTSERAFKTLEVEAYPNNVELFKSLGFKCREIKDHPLDMLAFHCTWYRK